MKNLNKLFVSVDVDEWYQCRWATGSKNSIWPSIPRFFKQVYNQDGPIGELIRPIKKILQFFDEIGFKSTFFFTGYIAKLYPKIVSEIADNGHEIGCHNYHHLDYGLINEKKFNDHLLSSKKLLEDLSGTKVQGYRSPNSSIPPYLVNSLLSNDFNYDSSVTPTRSIFGKFGEFTNSPQFPYITSNQNIGVQGDSGLLEIPWASFPILKTPAGSGITHRIFGNLYNSIATKYSLRKGTCSYYFHPYEVDEYISYKSITNIKFPFKVKIFMKNIGEEYFKNLKRFLLKYKNRLINGSSLYAEYRV